MKEEIEQISSERIDDIPVVVEWLRQMQIVKWIDKKLSQPHRNHQGLSYVSNSHKMGVSRTLPQQRL